MGKVERAIAGACRAAVPAYSTTANNAILREAGIPPARVLLEGARRRQAARLSTLHEHHPVVARAGRDTRIGRLADLVAKRPPTPLLLRQTTPLPRLV